METPAPENPVEWLIPVSEIKPGGSAILGGNTLAFFAIHHVALFAITVSTVSSIIVILKITQGWRNSSVELDFPLRFPLYLAVAEIMWGLSHFIDHFYLVTVQKFPNSYLVTHILSINIWLFFGYQHLMHASVAAYTYFRIIHRVRLDLGVWEWKLHLLCWAFLLCTVSILAWFHSFGCSGYYLGPDITSKAGLVFGGLAAMTATLNACCTTFGYCRIQRKLLATLKLISDAEGVVSTSGGPSTKNRPKKQSTVTRCLNTYVRIAACLYVPLAVILWVGVIVLVITNSIEPFTPFLIVIVANSSGWANAYGYFRNEQIRKERMKQREVVALRFTSTGKPSGDGH